ncbi:ATP-binding cassette domain-containing protein [Rhizobium puerariae]|uniref:ATP-binding cassette domain-containing protein n=1 Tax=Rhizobium puerariae TaxID=1585791 RepID=A0ABV6AL79_9HYPH
MNPRYLSLIPVAVAAVAPLVLPAYYITLMNFIGLASIVVIGLVLLTGIGGLTSFGQAAFVGVGAYTTAWLTANFGLSPWLTIFAAVIATAISGWLIGLLTLKLSGHYLPLSTIAWSLSLFFLVGNIAALGGHDGIPGLPGISVFGRPLSGPAYTWLIWIFVALAFLSVRNLLDSRNGRAVRSLRGRTVMLEAFGVDTAGLKTLIFVHAAVLAGISGWLYAHLVQFVNATPFGLNSGIEYLFMAVIGGASSLWGGILGSGLFILIRDGLQDIVPGLIGTSGAAESVVFGLLMVLILQKASGGLTPYLARLLPPAPPRIVKDDAATLPARPKPAAGTSILKVEGLVKRFGGLTAVNGVGFNLTAGHILGVIGPNGAGKSTLFNLLTGVLTPNEGVIELSGERMDRRPQAAFAKLGVARTFQHVMLRGDMSVLENVAVGAHLRGRRGAFSAILGLDREEEAAIFANARRQLERVGLGEYLHMPAGSLALGQQRILEIARALAADPVVLLLDEPAAGLRYHEKQKLDEVLRQLREEGMTILIVEHDMEFVMNLVDRLVVVDFGQKIAEGLPEEIQENSRVQQAYLGVDA